MLRTLRIPAYDPELVANVGHFPSAVTNDATFNEWRAQPEMSLENIQAMLDENGLVHEECIAPVPGGTIVLSIVRPAGASTPLPAMYDIHSGGMIFGNRFHSFLPETLEWAAKHQLVLVSPEYTLAPEEPAPRAAIECYAGLKWVVEQSSEMGIDPQRIILAGVSGGGGLAASVGLLARDNAGPELLAQMLICPQLDDRHKTVSSLQFSLANGAIDPWPSETNQYAWNALLGEGHEDRADVSIYASPARATDLSGLPPTYIDAGGNEVLRDADVAYASLLWESGVNAELHIWPGAYHGFDVLAPMAPVSIAAREARSSWLTRVLSASRS